MPSPFPGMDPYLEDEAIWPDFHRRLVAAFRDVLLPGLDAQRYRLVVRTRQYATDGPREHSEDYLETRDAGAGRLVTLVDVVSPSNKTTEAGRQAYLATRSEARSHGANLVEVDLVLQGQPTLDYSREGLPHWDYAVTVTRASPTEKHEIYSATLQKRLPRFRLPLAPDDRDTVLDLQTTFSRCYQEGGFAGRIDYRRDPSVPLAEEDRRWLAELLTEKGLREPHEQIARVAYALWEREGRPHGRDQEHWHQAVDQLRREREEPGVEARTAADLAAPSGLVAPAGLRPLLQVLQRLLEGVGRVRVVWVLAQLLQRRLGLGQRVGRSD